MRGVAVLLFLTFVLAGCGDKANDGGFETPSKEDGAYVITLTADHAFDPDQAKVPTDSIVAFRAQVQGCSVASDESGGPDSRTQYGNGLVPKGEDFRWFAPSDGGEFHVYCSLHRDKGMEMTLRVG